MSAYCLFGMFTTAFSFVSVIVFFASITYLLQFGRSEFGEAPGGSMTIILWTIGIQLVSSVTFVLFMEYDPCLNYIKDNLETCQSEGICCDCFEDTSERCERACRKCGSICESLMSKIAALILYFLLLGGLLLFIKLVAKNIYENDEFVEKLEPLEKLISLQLEASMIYYPLMLILWLCIFKKDRE